MGLTAQYEVIGHERAQQAGGRNILRFRIACQDQGLHGGLLRRHGIHLLAVNNSGNAGTNGDLVRQHFHFTAGGVDNQMLNVALAGNQGGGVQVQLLDHRAPVDDDRGIHCGFIYCQLGNGALGGADLGAGGAVDNFPNAAGQVYFDWLPALRLFAL